MDNKWTSQQERRPWEQPERITEDITMLTSSNSSTSVAQAPQPPQENTDGLIDAFDDPPATPPVTWQNPPATPPVTWQIGSIGVQREFVQFVTVYLLIFIIACTSLANLSLREEKTELWASLLSMMCGIIVPQPKYPKQRKAEPK